MGYLLICRTPHLDHAPVHKNGRVDADPIESNDILSRSASDHLATSFSLLLIKPCCDNIIMYGMQHIDDKHSAIIVTFVLRVLDHMTVYVFLNGDKLPDSACRWALCYTNGKLTYWSQLDTILSRYITDVTCLSSVTISKMISKSIQQIERGIQFIHHHYYMCVFQFGVTIKTNTS